MANYFQPKVVIQVWRPKGYSFSELDCHSKDNWPSVTFHLKVILEDRNTGIPDNMTVTVYFLPFPNRGVGWHFISQCVMDHKFNATPLNCLFI